MIDKNLKGLSKIGIENLKNQQLILFARFQILNLKYESMNREIIKKRFVLLNKKKFLPLDEKLDKYRDKIRLLETFTSHLDNDYLCIHTCQMLFNTRMDKNNYINFNKELNKFLIHSRRFLY